MSGWHLFTHERSLISRRSADLPFLFGSSAIRQVAVIFLVVFSSVYIFEVLSGVGLSKGESLALTLSYFALVFLGRMITIPFASQFSFKYGFKKTIYLSIVPFVFFIPLMILSSGNVVFFIPSAILWGANTVLFRWGYDGFFTKAADSLHFGREIGFERVILAAVSVISPIFAGFIVYVFGFEALFLSAVFCVVLSGVLLYPACDYIPKNKISFVSGLKTVLKHKKMALSYMGYAGAESLSLTVWPLFLFSLLGNSLGIGGFISFAVLVSSVVIFLLGSWIDKKGRRGEGDLVLVGSPLVCISWLARVFSTLPFFIVLADSLYRFAEQLVSLPLDALSYQKAAEGKVASALFFREITLNLGVFATTVLLIPTVLWGGFSAAFLVGALISLLPLLVVRVR